MIITLQNISKKFRKEWIIKELSIQLENDAYLIAGPNGSGKSTLLKIISGFLSPTKGSIKYTKNNTEISVNDIYKKVAYSAPYIDVFEEYTLKELFDFYVKFKSLKVSNFKEFKEIIELNNTKDKEIKNFSSGMRQRVKLGLTILSKTDLLLLDEPTSYLDKEAIKWYQKLILNNINDRVVLVASNAIDDDSFFCKKSIDILDYK